MRGVSNLDKEWLHGPVISPCKIQEQCERRTVENKLPLVEADVVHRSGDLPFSAERGWRSGTEKKEKAQRAGQRRERCETRDSGSNDFLDDKRGIEEGLISCVQIASEIGERPQQRAHRVGPMALRQHVPISQPAATCPRARDTAEKPLVIFRRHILENVAEVEAVNGRPLFHV